MEAESTWALFDEIAAAVRASVVGGDRLAAGTRAGQYGLDVAADALVVPWLLDAGFGVVSEESGAHSIDRDVVVVVDPVDGSTNASRGLPGWATSLCAVDAEGMCVSTVVDQASGVIYRGRRGGGAWRSLEGRPFEPISVADPVASEAIVALNGWSDERPKSRQFRALGAASVELCLVADGSFDGYANLDGDAHGAWDYLGALLVLVEAGGVGADREGRGLVTADPLARRSIVAASGPALLAAMMGR